jgi:sulfite exporter TauE/SafE
MMIWTALIMGFAGSLHCVGMCCPLAMAVTRKALVSRLLYNIGRILTYGVMGSVIASIGFAFPVSKYQDLLSLSLGLLMIIVGLTSFVHVRMSFGLGVLSKLNQFLKKLFATFLKKRNLATVFFLGTLNGLLPCGLTFLALTYCVILPTPSEGFAFMLLFGAGTLPALLGFTSVFSWILSRLKFTPQRVTTAMIILSGLLLISRGLLEHSHTKSDSTNKIVVCQ